MTYLVGQRVIVSNHIGTVEEPLKFQDTSTTVRVRLYGREYASDYSIDNVKPLPNGQL